LDWNRPEVNLRLAGLDGTVIVEGQVAVEGDSRTFDVPAGKKGVYTFEMNVPVRHPVAGPDFWIESSLDRSVVWTGDPNPTPLWKHGDQPQTHAIMGRWLITQCSVPRRWWFWVPPGTRSFTCRTQWIQNYQSQREDWGITVFSPRGQRVRTLWGDLDMDRGRPFDTGDSRTATAVVNVEPGAAGRFWCVELRFADSHNYSKISFSLDGVPPYLARSPEEWFDASTGTVPAVPLYDDDPFMQFAKPKRADDPWPWLANWSPCPALGDPDGAEIRGEASVALWNPEGRPLALKVGTYLPRVSDSNAPPAHVVVAGANGKTVMERDEVLRHLHGEGEMPEPLPATGKGVARLRVAGAERWFAFTYPAVPTVLEGQPLPGGGTRFSIEVGSARNWYFLVPRGLRAFRVKARAAHATDVMHLEVNAPDRTQALIYGREGEREVTVPPGLDGKRWHLRVDVGSGSTMPNVPGEPVRYLHHYLEIDLHGVPGLLAPTWEQWFDPKRPVAPERR
jgi:hypothetical protein